MAATEAALRPGDNLGRFQLLVPIGAGGMGRVWVAREENTGRLFAIKTTLSDEKSNGEFWNVLLDEARIAAQVQARSVCAIHAFEVDEQRGVPYLVMDYSDGGSLHELLEACPTHRIDFPIAATIAALICDGLQIAHDLSDENGESLGVVHRDVSPQNILISASGHVQLTDFGVAKARGRLHAATETGEVKGKLSYMAPEQVTTRNVDRRADVFALGCVLYEATVGERPFHGDDAVATLYQLLERPLIPPSARAADYPEGLEEIVIKALQRDPADRYQSAEELGQALTIWVGAQGRLITERDIAAIVREHLGTKIADRARRITSAETEIDSPPPPPQEQTLGGSTAATLESAKRARKSKVTWLIAGTGTLAALLVGWVALGHPHDPPPVLPAASSVARVEPQPTNSALAESAKATEPITLTLRAEPARATLFLDDGTALPNPSKLSLTKDDAPHSLRATATGFSERSEEVHFDRSKEVVIVLSPSAGSERPHGGAIKGVVAPPTANVTAVRPGELPPIVRKPPRTLDTDNPFAPQ